MSKFVWFVLGLALGDLWSGWLMHILYVTVILFLVWGGHHPFHCAP